jgi:hypothetical protein
MGVWLVAHLVRDEGVAGSNPATPTMFPAISIAYAASYAERNSTSDPAEPFCCSSSVQREGIARVRKDQVRILLDSGAQAELAELHVVRHLETFPHVHDPELARSPTVFGTHSRGHLGVTWVDF